MISGQNSDHDAKAMTEDIVFKTGAYGDTDFDDSDLDSMRMDGSIYREIGPHPRILDMYSFCGVAMLNEVMRGDLMRVAAPHYARHGEGVETQLVVCGHHHDHSKASDEPLRSYNNLTVSKKLRYGLQIAEG